MRNIIAAVAVFVSMSALACSMAAPLAEHPSSKARAEDEAAIRKIVALVEEGWNKGDGKVFAAPFAEDADYVVVNGMRVKGRNEIALGHQRIFDTVYKNSHNTGTVQSIRFLRDDVAVVHVEWRLQFRADDAAREGGAISTMVMTKQRGQWGIAAFHNTSIASSQK
jgi:uncharacterized protein (TIGR02246 family)